MHFFKYLENSLPILLGEFLGYLTKKGNSTPYVTKYRYRYRYMYVIC